MSLQPLRIVVTGAAGQIAYSLLLSLCNGSVFGAEQPLILQLLDIESALSIVKGVAMELEDCSLPSLQEVMITSDPLKAFDQADYVIMLGAMPRKEGMQRKDLLQMNVGIFKAQGQALDKVAKKTVKVLVVGNPANTNALICAHFAPSIPSTQFSALTKLDENRATAMLSHQLNVSPSLIRNVCVWGNHSNTQFPHLDHAQMYTSSTWTSIPELPSTFVTSFIQTVANRGAAVIQARKLSSAMSAAKAVCDHVRLWHQGTSPGQFTSMAVISNGEYNVPKGLIFSYPVTISSNGTWTIVQGLPISSFAQSKLDLTIRELEEERNEALQQVS